MGISLQIHNFSPSLKLVKGVCKQIETTTYFMSYTFEDSKRAVLLTVYGSVNIYKNLARISKLFRSRFKKTIVLVNSS